jgi:hypothetical protein
MKLIQRFWLLAAVFGVGLLAVSLVSYVVLGRIKVTGPIYDRIIQTKDISADVLPPPLYVIESYLVAVQAINSPSSEQEALIKQLPVLQKKITRIAMRTGNSRTLALSCMPVWRSLTNMRRPSSS